MTSIRSGSYVERPAFFSGQRLLAADLEGLEAFSREMRWHHNRTLHQPGIGSGLAVIGKKGDRKVTITPGYAIDILGREMLLLEPHEEPVPPVADNGAGKPKLYDLTITYPDDATLAAAIAETREAICLAGQRGAVRLLERPAVCWTEVISPTSPPPQVEQGLRIALARVAIQGCELNADPFLGQRRNARPAAQPKVACGKWDPDLSPDAANRWVLWTLNHQSGGSVVGISACIDTQTAGFASTPCYAARVVGDRPVDLGNGFWLFDGPLSIWDPKPNRFTVEVPIWRVDSTTRKLDSLPILQQADVEKVGWSVTWMGVEG